MPESSSKSAEPTTEHEHPRFRVEPLRAFLLVLLLSLTWLTALVVYLPAGWVWAQVARQVPVPEVVEVQQVGGTVWSGDAWLRVQGLPLRLSWQLQPGSLIHGFVPLEWRLNSPGSQAEGSVTAMLDGRVRMLLRRARVDLEEVTAHDLGIQPLSIPSVMTLESFFGVWRPEQGFGGFQGWGQWSGGNVTWPMGDQPRQSRIPALEGRLTSNNGQPELVLMEQGTSEPAVRLVMDAGGRARVELYKRWIDFLGLDFAPDAAPGDVVFRVSRQVTP
ncbi:type II secretion system protein N [Vreelandella utahensis]|uniref:type II secretion system protein N n=1 Tax=Vreelandella halophila TaxID=86177 RepID=UPI0009874B4F|nr:type II secretion system protein N [Halomonas utahensis]